MFPTRRLAVLCAAALSIAAGRAETSVTVTSPAGRVTQALPDAGGPFALDVPLARNAVNRVTVSATDAAGHVASQDLLITQVSLDALVVSQVTVERLEPEEIEQLVNEGVIDLDDPANYNVSQFTIVITVAGQPVEVSVPIPMPINEDSGGDAPMPMPDADNAGATPPPAPREIIVFLEEIGIPGEPAPVPMPAVLVIEGRIKSLKEFFAVRLLLLNVSGIFTLADVTANITLPAGALAPILPSTGTVAYGDILPGDGGTPGQSERQFIVRGDRVGVHDVEVDFGGRLTGPGIPEDAPIPFAGRARASVEVKGPPTFQVQVFHPDSVTAGTPYDLRVDITNTGDLPALYASLDLDVGADADLVHCTTDPATGEPACDEVPGPETRSLGHVYAGRKVSQTFTVRPKASGAVVSCVAASDQNIALSVIVGTRGCLAGHYPPADAGLSGPTASVIPVSNALGVGIYAPVTALFSARIDTATVTADSFRVFDAARDVVPGAIRFTETFGRTVAIWQPAGDGHALRPNSTYTAQLTQDIRGLDGRALAAGLVSSFTTTGDAYDDVTPPDVVLAAQPPVDPDAVLPGQVVLVDAYAADQGSGVARLEARLKDLDDPDARFDLIDQRSVAAGDRPPFLFALDSARLDAGHRYQLLVTAFDAMANAQDATLSLVVTGSAAPPQLVLPADPAGPVLQGVSLDVTPVTVGDTAKTVRYYLDGSAETYKTASVPPFQASVQTLALALGTHTVRAVAEDALGQTSADELTFELVENRNMPVVGFGAAVDGEVHPKGSSFTVAGSASDPVGLDSVRWYLDTTGKRRKADALATGTAPFVVDTTGLADGKHLLIGIATNRLGVSNDANDPASILEFTVVTPAGGPPPAPPAVDGVTPPDAAGIATVTGTAPAGSRVDVTNARSGLTLSVYADAAGAFVAPVEAESGDTLALVVVDYRVSAEPSAPSAAIVPAAPALLRLDLLPAQVDFTALGAHADVTATAVYDDGASRDVTGAAAWTSATPAVATVGAGRIVAHANGQSTVTASFGGVSGTCAVRVTVRVLDHVTVAPDPVVLTAIGATQPLTVTGHYSDGSSEPLADGNTFSTADARIATVDAAGLVRAARRGTTTVTVARRGLAPVLVGVTVDTDEDLPPTAAITSPPDGREVERGDLLDVVVRAEDVDGGVTRVILDATGATSSHEDRQVSPPATETTETFGLEVAADAAIGGTIDLRAIARDTAGQDSVPARATLHVVDRTAPAATIDEPLPDTAFVPGSAVRVTVSATDAVGVVEIRYETSGAVEFDDASSIDPAASPASATFTFTIPPEVVEGEIVIHGYARDAAGNEGRAADVRIAVQPDTTPPATRATGVSDPGTGATATVSFETTDGVDDLDHVELYFRRDAHGTFNRFTDAEGANPRGEFAAGPDGRGTIPFDSTRMGGDGAFEFYTVGVDAAGNREPAPAGNGGAPLPDQAATFAAGTAWSVITTPTVLGATDTTYDGSNLRVRGTTLTVDGHHSFLNVELVEGAVLTHPETDLSNDPRVDVAAWTLTIDAASRIDVDARGYLGGRHEPNTSYSGETAPHAQGASYRSGGSYGGIGATVDGTPNPPYGYVTDPADLGSGGSAGACGRGGDGGGRIALATINLVNDGAIRADGEAAAACQPGSGSGGAVKILATTASGTGTVTANGGAGEVGGGGGRVLLQYTDVATLDAARLRALGGDGRNADGGNGSVTLRNLDEGNGTLVVDGQGTPTTWSPLAIPPGYVFDAIVLRNGARVLGDEPIVVGDALRIETGSLLTHSTGLLGGLSITAQRVLIDGTSAIDVSGRGYRGGRRDGNEEYHGLTLGGQPGAPYRSGGSYGGVGASHDGAAAPLYGHPADPRHLGSGGSAGACGAGFNGGGRVSIDASERVVVDGAILADGLGGSGCQPGSGSGGSIRIATSLLMGTGRVSADGGAGEVGGGGGRIAVTYAYLGPDGANLDGTRAITAQGGHGQNAWGSAGTVLLRAPNQRWGDLYVDEKVDGATSSSWSTLTRIGFGKAVALTADTLTTDGQVALLPHGLQGLEFNPNVAQDVTFTILDNTATTITVDTSGGRRLIDVAAPGDTYAAVYRFDNVTFRRGGQLNLGDRLVVADTLRLDEHGLLTHYGATTTIEPRLDVVAGTIDVRATGRIDVTGRGYLGGRREGNADDRGMTVGLQHGATYRSGGSHGGLGGTLDGLGPGPVHGDQTDPDDLGSGGSIGACGAGYNGGGRMRLRAGRMIVDGALRADGAAGSGCQPGSGSGGSIHLTVGDLSGSGTVSASGGAGEVGGGGGRVAIVYDASSFPRESVHATGGQGRNRVGGNGTIYLRDTHATLGELLISGDGFDTPDGLSPIPAGATYENLTHARRPLADPGRRDLREPDAHRQGARHGGRAARGARRAADRGREPAVPQRGERGRADRPRAHRRDRRHERHRRQRPRLSRRTARLERGVPRDHARAPPGLPVPLRRQPRRVRRRIRRIRVPPVRRSVRPARAGGGRVLRRLRRRRQRRRPRARRRRRVADGGRGDPRRR